MGSPLRFCADYRRLNDVTEEDAYPLLRINNAFDSFSKARWFSTLDLASGHKQVEVDPKDRPKTISCLNSFEVLVYAMHQEPSRG